MIVKSNREMRRVLLPRASSLTAGAWEAVAAARFRRPKALQESRPPSGIAYARIATDALIIAGEQDKVKPTLNGWTLLPRVLPPAILGLQLLILGLRCRQARTHAWRPWANACLCAVLLGGGALAIRPANPVDLIYQTGMLAAPGDPVMPQSGMAQDWLHYGGDAAGTRYSRLDQIKVDNVATLQEAWRVRIGRTTGLETALIKVKQRLYVCNAYNDVVAMDAATGRLCRDFGNGGVVSLLTGLGPDHSHFYAVTSAPTIVRGKVVLGGWVSDGMQWGEPAGVVRAFDALTGKLAWAWDIGRPDRQALPPPRESYTHSTPNAWAPFSADDKSGIVYVPTGNPAVDYYGGLRRPFDETFGTAITAIDAETGKTRWTYQTVHHDIWDWGNASQPTLVDMPTAQGVRPALIQPTKRGELFVLDRSTGKPLKRVEERPVPQGGIVPGERL